MRRFRLSQPCDLQGTTAFHNLSSYSLSPHRHPSPPLHPTTTTITRLCSLSASLASRQPSPSPLPAHACHLRSASSGHISPCKHTRNVFRSHQRCKDKSSAFLWHRLPRISLLTQPLVAPPPPLASIPPTTRLSTDDPTRIIKVVASDGKSGEQKEISYTNCKVIGNGSFGVVFAARLLNVPKEEEEIAIKKVLQDKRFKVGLLSIPPSPSHISPAHILPRI